MNKRLFQSQRPGFAVPKADTVNEAGGTAYRMSPEHALAQLAATCTFGGSYYIGAEQELSTVLSVAKKVSPDYVAKTAVFARQRGFMKDMPALLLCQLMTSEEGLNLIPKVWPRIVDNGRMLRGFFKILWSDVTGRHNVGSRVRNLVHKMFDDVPAHVLFRWSVGNDPSLVDVIKMIHPKPKDSEKEALYGYLLGKGHDAEALPPLVKQFEAFKAYKAGKGAAVPVPAVPFQMVDSLGLNAAEWSELFKSGGWHFVRMNLNTAARQGVLKSAKLVDLIATRLRDAEAIHKSRVFPYQLLAAYTAASAMPVKITNALHDALEISLDNVPQMEGDLAVCIDTSGSMSCPATGYRGSATSAVRCVDVAGLVAAALLRKNPDGTTVVPFDTDVRRVRVDPRDSVMTNARKLALNGGGTNCACALKYLNAQKHKGNLVVYVSDNEAWVESRYALYYGGTGMATEWKAYKKRNPAAKLVNINIVANTTSQMPEGQKDIYQIGGFSDSVFTLIGDWLAGRGADHWVETIKAIDLDA